MSKRKTKQIDVQFSGDSGENLRSTTPYLHELTVGLFT